MTTGSLGHAAWTRCVHNELGGYWPATNGIVKYSIKEMSFGLF